ncbi:tetratricopeptide repeat protein [Pelomonas sp. Root1444]|uniref:tetratricopeptide repeat protein n=1 Tax=Pelomonas sp. Root1444 TaxID=1736464 RepID=UPI00138EF261|nr:tetratricopeptide repeat protein [Pelomonas sp. Root1444]
MDLAFRWLVFAALWIGLSTSATGAPRTPTPPIVRLGDYSYTVPVWWDKVQVKVPEHFQSMHEVEAYVYGKYGNDVGTSATWRMALKTYALAYQRFPRTLPVYLAHCHMRGGDLDRAAQIYADLYELSSSQAEEEHWYRVYLAFNAGLAYARLGRLSEAQHWYLLASRYLNDEGPNAGAIISYARQAEQALQDPDFLPYSEK